MSKIQNSDVKSEAELITAGATKSSLINDVKIYVAANSINKTLNQAITDGDIGGGGTGGINYISNPDAEVDAAGYVTYLDTATAAPVDGVGGTSTLTFATTTSSPLRGTKSFLLTKSAGSKIGNGVSIPFTIDSADKAKILRFSFDYETAAGYLDDQISMYIYDITNSRLIEVVDRSLKATSLQNTFIGSFQTSPDSVSYRAIFHIAGTSTAAYTIKFDNVIVGPQTLTKGAIVTDMKPSTGTLSDNTNVTAAFYEGRRGDTLIYEGRAAWTGVGVGVTFRITLPAGYVIDFNKTGGAGSTTSLGSASWYDVSTPISHWLNPYAATANQISFLDSSSNNAVWDGSQAAAGDAVTFKIEVPIVGWSSNAVMSEDSGNREVYCRVQLSAAQAVTSIALTTILLNNIIEDTTGSFDAGTYTYNAPETGIYDIAVQAYATNLVASDNMYVTTRVNNVDVSQRFGNTGSSTASSFTSSATVKLVKGDTVVFYIKSVSDTAYNLDNSPARTFATIAKRSSPQTVMGSEVVAATYIANSGQSITGLGAVQTILYNQKVIDTHGSYNTSTGEYIVPVSGTYRVDASARLSPNSSWEIDETVATYIYVNGVAVAYTFWECNATAAFNWSPPNLPVFWQDILSKDDIITVRIFQQSDVSILLSADNFVNRLTVLKVG
jgi:hypothetical protein